MRIEIIDWDAGNRAHFAEKGRCRKGEVEEVLSSRYGPLRAARVKRIEEERFRFEGRTAVGRMLVVIAARGAPGRFRPITCWPLEGLALERHLAWRRTVNR